MRKLLNEFMRAKSEAAHAKLQKYILDHPMALCMLEPEEIEYLKFYEFRL